MEKWILPIAQGKESEAIFNSSRVYKYNLVWEINAFEKLNAVN